MPPARPAEAVDRAGETLYDELDGDAALLTQDIRAVCAGDVGFVAPREVTT